MDLDLDKTQDQSAEQNESSREGYKQAGSYRSTGRPMRPRIHSQRAYSTDNNGYSSNNVNSASDGGFRPEGFGANLQGATTIVVAIAIVLVTIMRKRVATKVVSVTIMTVEDTIIVEDITTVAEAITTTVAEAITTIAAVVITTIVVVSEITVVAMAIKADFVSILQDLIQMQSIA